ncbi:hypothetical protein FUA26_04160 [Seonamhaeicola algicola]|uniref:UDP-N-acetyl glucosamine 2-epimerase n=1 Tax=Seonamhaeicola algicola TaxID=1719036 RepID=A0A5C7AW08_9FLAO|nr:hypothetical protein [Seonamhaeicola algicola]TXE12996.1 hypothetical protein FUA26_04160 [Seonamhaeicola algicola]
MKYKSKRFLHVWEDILQIWFSGYLEIVSRERREQISPISIKDKCIVIFKEFIKEFIKLFIKNRIPKNKIWCFSISSNNYESLKSIKANLDDSIFVHPFSFNDRHQNSYPINFSRKFLYSLWFPFNFLIFYFQSKSGSNGLYDLFFKANGIYSESLRLIKKSKPKAIIFANDHEIIPRGLLLAAKNLNVPIIYIQHASVSNYFPVLDFDYALLEGKDAKDKYLNIGNTSTCIYLVGMPKFDKYLERVNRNTLVKVIGIAYNAMDNLELIKRTVIVLQNYFPDIELIVRAHPSDKRSLNLDSVKKSIPQKESVFDFLSRIDLLIAAESSIHLEAIMLNVYSISYSFSNSKFLDYYGFVKNNLVKHYLNLDDIIEEINSIGNNKPNVQKKAEYYNAALNSDFYGKSSEKIRDIIKSKIL